MCYYFKASLCGETDTRGLLNSRTEDVIKMSNRAMRSPVYFTKAKEEEKLWTEEKKKEDIQRLNGEEVRDFYQSLLQESSEERPRETRDSTGGRVKRAAGSYGPC